jgi:hypothetical protein
MDRRDIKIKALINLLEVEQEDFMRAHAAVTGAMSAMEKHAVMVTSYVSQLNDMKALPAGQAADFDKMVQLLAKTLPVDKKEDHEDGHVDSDTEEDALAENDQERIAQRMQLAREARREQEEAAAPAAAPSEQSPQS